MKKEKKKEENWKNDKMWFSREIETRNTDL